MIYIKTYCYSEHELPFIVAQLEEMFEYIDGMFLYEYDYTHTGLKKEFRLEKYLHTIPRHLREKLNYRKISLDGIVEYAYEDEELIHAVNEPVQRSWFFNDNQISLNDEDIIVDVDVDEILYGRKFKCLLLNLKIMNKPISFRLNQFFFKTNYFWRSAKFSSPSIYKYGMVKEKINYIKGLKICHRRDLDSKAFGTYGAHMSWNMPLEFMVRKLHSYSHPVYREFADADKLKEAIENKVYIFDKTRNFKITELDMFDKRIPKYLQKNNIFDYMPGSI